MMYMNSATFRTPKKASLSEERSTSLKMFIARFPFFPSRTEVIDAGTALLSRVWPLWKTQCASNGRPAP
jgi:hypothetical protein